MNRQRIDPEAHNDNDHNDAYAQQRLSEGSCYGGKGKRRNKKKQGKRELHQEKAPEIRKHGETGVLQEEKLHAEKRHPNEHKNEEKFGKEKLPPNVRLRDPPLTIADESFSLDDSTDQKDPRKYKQERNVTAKKTKDKRRDRKVIRRGRPVLEFMARVDCKQSKRDENLGPVAANIFLQDLEGLGHALGL